MSFWATQADARVRQVSREKDYMSAPPEIRNKGGSLDEVFAEGCTFHLEQMSATHWWMAVECGGKRVHINLHSRATIKASAETEDA